MPVLHSKTELEKNIKRLRSERQSKRAIINALDEGLILFKPNLTTKTINSSALKLLGLTNPVTTLDNICPLFKNKKSTLPFDLLAWLQSLIDINCKKSVALKVWKRDSNSLKTQPLKLRVKLLCRKKGKLKNLLLSITDQSFQQESAEQQRLMQAAFNSSNGQFIANEKGYILEANASFYAMSGLSASQLKQLTLVQWLEQQVALKEVTSSILLILLKQRFWSGEVTLHPQADTTFHAILSLSMISDADANIEHYIVTLQNITDIKEAQTQLNQLAFYDSLTKLANRILALEHLRTTLKNNLHSGTYSSLFHINIERFKSINDAFGRETGDRLLQLTAQSLKSLFKDHEIVARAGGDEFVVITPNKTSCREIETRQALKTAHKISRALKQHYHVDEHTLHSSVRVGLIVYPHESDTAEQLLVNADLASTEAKKIKSNHKAFVYEPYLSQEVIERRQIEIDLNHCDVFGQLELYYQAQIGREDALHGAETLIRWKHPILGFIRPDKFISVAEESRQILKIGHWIIQQAFIQAKKWVFIQPDFNLSINISPIQFHEADFVKQLKNLLHETGTLPNNITLELTEGILISDTEQALKKIEQLDKMGFKVSIDDFGTGYSSLSYLQRLPIHELKIDQSFILRLPGSQDDTSIVKTIIQLAQSKNLTIVAEGVETQAQADFLRNQPENILLQGYLYSRPCTALAFETDFLPLKHKILSS